MKPEVHARRGRVGHRGSALLYAAVMLGVASVAVISLVAMVWSHMRFQARSDGRLRAFYAAESGAQLVVDWFNRGFYAWFSGLEDTPERYPGVTFHNWDDAMYSDPDFQDLFQPFTEEPDRGQFVNTAGASAFLYNDETRDSIVIDTRRASRENIQWAGYLPSLVETHTGFSGGVVEYLEIAKPDPSSSSGPYGGKICHVVSVGRDPSTGAVATVETDLVVPWLPEILSPAALISKSTAASNGQFNVHWGEVWAKDNLDLTNPISVKYQNAVQDQWFHGRSAAWIIGKDSTNFTWYADGMAPQGFTKIQPSPSSINYFQPFKYLSADNEELIGYEEAFYQHESLTWPDYNYNVVKSYCLRHDYPIFRTTADGRLIVGKDAAGNPIIKTFSEQFNLAATVDPDSIDREELPPIYFIDTIDGQAPKADGSNIATLRSSGTGPFYYGYFFVAANIIFDGSGNAPTFDFPERPDRTISSDPITNCRLNGLLYVYGSASFQGTGDVYGTVFAKRGFLGGGGWTIWYDWRLSDPLRLAPASRVAPQLWCTYYHYPSATG